jgi:hypothetical protein
MSKAWTWCKKLETPCHNELDEKWGDGDGENFLFFLDISLQNLPNKTNILKVGPLGLGFS